MNAQTVIVAGIQSSAVLLLAIFAATLFRRHPSARQLVCKAGLVATVVIALGAHWFHAKPKPVVTIDMAGWEFIQPSVTPPPGVSQTAPSNQSSVQQTAATSSLLQAESLAGAVDPMTFALWTWVAGAVILAGSTFYGYIRLAGLRKGCQKVESGNAYQSVLDASSLLNVKTPSILAGATIQTPFVAGIIRPTLYLPESWVDLDDQEMLDSVCLHEVAHLAAKDLHWKLAFRVMNVLLWPQVLLWMLNKPAATASEELCDQRVLQSGCSPQTYAKALLSLKENLKRPRSVVPVGIGAVTIRSSFGRRIERIMSGSELLRQRLSRSGAIGLGTTCALVAFLTTNLIAAASWRKGESDQIAFLSKPMDGQLDVQIETPDGKPFKGYAGVYFDGRFGVSELVEAQVHEGRVHVDLSLHAGYPRATLVAFMPGYGLTYQLVWPVEKPVSKVTLFRATQLKGQLLLPNGKPGANLRVVPTILVLNSQAPSEHSFLDMENKDLRAILGTTTDANGNFVIQNLPQGAGVRVEVLDETYATTSLFGDQIMLAKGPTSTASPIKLRIGSVFEGQVMRDGKPVAGLRVGSQENEQAGSGFRGLGGSAVTDRNGHYRMTKLLAGTYNIMLDLQDTFDKDSTAAAHERVAIRQGETKSGLNFDLVPGGFVVGTVTKADGSPAVGYEVGIYGPAHPQSSAWVQSAKVQADGTYKLRVPAGKQFVYVMVPVNPESSGTNNQQATVKVVDGQTTKVNFQLN